MMGTAFHPQDHLQSKCSPVAGEDTGQAAGLSAMRSGWKARRVARAQCPGSSRATVSPAGVRALPWPPAALPAAVQRLLQEQPHYD